MIIHHLSESVRYTGRWHKGESGAVTTAPGAMLEIAFKGCACELLFDTKTNAEPFPHLYLQLDGGAKMEAPLAPFLRIEAPVHGAHTAAVYFKSAMEAQQRWYEPLVGKITFLGAEAEAEGILPEDNRKIIEFIGDSITEGIWVDEQRVLEGTNRAFRKNMVYENDSTATWAYLTAQKLGMKPTIMGYGAVGLTKAGNGGVPAVAAAYPYAFFDKPIESSGACAIVINHGANDMNADAAVYLREYEAFLDLVRSRNPDAMIVALGAFGGYHCAALGEMIPAYNRARGDHVVFIDTAGWIPSKPMHPTREGHAIAAMHLSAELKKLLQD